MTKKLLWLFALVLMLVCLFASCGDDEEYICLHANADWSIVKEVTCTENGIKKYQCPGCDFSKEETIYATNHVFGEWSTTTDDKDCTVAGEKERICSVCDEKEIEVIEPREEHSFPYSYEWTVLKEATCTENGEREAKCDYCEAKTSEVIEAKHNYTNGICTVCDKAMLNITLPELPIEVNTYYNGALEETVKILSMKLINATYHSPESSYLEISWSGEKTYDIQGNSHSSKCRIGWKLYDSEGFVLDSGTSYSSGAVEVGEKFKDSIFNMLLSLDPNETYTLVILNVE